MAMENIKVTKSSSTIHNFFYTAVVVILTVILVVLAMPNTEKPRMTYTLNEPWISAQLISPGEILIKKDPKIIAQEQHDALLNEYMPYYTFDSNIGPQQVKRFLEKYSPGYDGISVYCLHIIADDITKLYERGIIPQMDFSRMMDKDSLTAFMLVKQKDAVRVMVKDITPTKAAYESLFNDPRLSAVHSVLQQMDINQFLTPNIKYDSRRSKQAKEDILATIPTNSGVMKQGQEIINRGEIVTEEKARMIDSYNDFLSSNSENSTVLVTNTVQAIYVLLLMMLFMAYLQYFRPDYLTKPRALAMVFTLLALFPILNSLLMRFDPRSVYVLPLCLVPMFIRVFLDSRTAFMAHVVMVLICAAAVSDKFEFIYVEIIAGLVAICALSELYKRSQIFIAAFVIFVTYVIAYSIVKFLDNREIAFEALKHAYFCFLGNGILLLLTYPLMYIIEKAFGFISPVTLFELSDTNRSLLRKLSEVAPGTFQHSITVSNLAAAIASEVGAKSLLVRTGALYHDIGKMHHPVFFTENQSGVNPHDRLQPQDSARIIIGHVNEGLRMAEKNNIPDVIRVFIQTHHGKGVARYFYNTYCNSHPDEDVDITPFQYPGPNPFSLEQAILMMADSVEAASRSLPEYTEETISALVNKIIDTQVTEGYFQDSPITFRDIATAKRVLIEKLKSIYHTRIQYPELNIKHPS